MIIKANSPILDEKGRLLALWAKDYEMRDADVFSWTWFSPSSQSQLISGPQFNDADKTIPENRGVLRVLFHMGQITVLGCELHGDADGAFNSHWFCRPEEPVGETWRGKLTAVRVLREYLRDPMTSSQMDMLEEMFTHYAEREESQ